MEQYGKYGGDIEFLLISQFLKTNLIVYSNKDDVVKQLTERGFNDCEFADDTMEIIHTGTHAGHWELSLSPKEADDSPTQARCSNQNAQKRDAMLIDALHNSYDDDLYVDDSDNDDSAKQHSDEHEHLEKPNEPNVNPHSNNVDSVVVNSFERNEPHHKSCHREEQD